MNIFSKLGSLILGFAQNDALPWLENLFTHVEHDVVTDIIPEIEAAFAQAGVVAINALQSGDGFEAALSDALKAIGSALPGILAKTESVTLQDVFTAGAAAMANIAAAQAPVVTAPSNPPAPQ